MWLIIFFLVLFLLITGFLWLSFAVCRFHSIRQMVGDSRWKRGLAGAGIVIGLMIILYLVFDFVNMVIIVLHLLFAWLFCDAIAYIVRRVRPQLWTHYYPGICAIVFVFVWLAIGWVNAHRVVKTEYDIPTTKELGVDSLRVIGLSDLHIGATFHWQEFEEYVDEINAQHPDLVVIMGDYVDDDTSKEDMERCSKAMSRLQTRYGVYFVYGNHDEGYWNNSARGYSLEDMDRQLEANKVKILRDETEHIIGNVYLCGRLDKVRSRERKNASVLMQDRKASDYVITLDHEPNDFDAESASNMDLVISGHTHGGQFLGLGPVGVWIGANDAYYGHEKRGNTDFIISSGIGDWALKFKTGCIAEYVVLDVKGSPSP